MTGDPVTIDVHILDGETTPFDRLTALACSLMGVPGAIISLFRGDVSVFRSNMSLQATEVPKAESVASHVEMLGTDGILVVEDALEDPVLKHHPFVTGHNKIRFYVGAPVVRPDGQIIGAFGVVDTSPHPRPSDAQLKQMQLMAGMVTAIIDQEAEARARVGELRLLSLAERVAGLGQWYVDRVQGTVSWSDEVYRIHGVDRASFVPSMETISALYPEGDRPKLGAMIARALTEGTGYDFVSNIVRPDGMQRVVRAEALTEKDESGAVVALFGIVQDVTEQQSVLERVSRSEARYRLLADNMGDIILRVRPDGRPSYISPACEAVTGFTPAEFAAQPGEWFVHPDDVGNLIDAVTDGVEGALLSQRVQYRLRHKAGHFVWVEGNFRAVRCAEGTVTELVVVVRDISRQKALEDELIEARDRAEAGGRAKSDFLANMSHELRTPLTSVVGFAGLLKNSGSLTAEDRVFADRIATSGVALLDVINDILEYSKLEAHGVTLEARGLDVRALVRAAGDMVEAQCEAKGLALVVEVEPDVPTYLNGDAARLRQVMLNLLSNAVKFTRQGEIRLTVGGAGADDGTWRLAVAVHDTGIGITPVQATQLFERFTQADVSTTRMYGGTGLGLSISRGLIELMGGVIGAEGQAGIGSRFWFEVALPVADGVVADAVDEAIAPDRDARILMADDSANNRELMVAIMASLGLTLDTVCDGAEAVEAVRRGGYDLVLMDVHMPVMDGMQATRAIRALDGAVAGIPVVALTANVQAEQVAQCLAAGMDAHLTKPVQIGALVRTLTRFLNPVADAGEVCAA